MQQMLRLILGMACAAALACACAKERPRPPKPHGDTLLEVSRVDDCLACTEEPSGAFIITKAVVRSGQLKLRLRYLPYDGPEAFHLYCNKRYGHRGDTIFANVALYRHQQGGYSTTCVVVSVVVPLSEVMVPADEPAASVLVLSVINRSNPGQRVRLVVKGGEATWRGR